MRTTVNSALEFLINSDAFMKSLVESMFLDESLGDECNSREYLKESLLKARKDMKVDYAERRLALAKNE